VGRGFGGIAGEPAVINVDLVGLGEKGGVEAIIRGVEPFEI